ncbi:MAG: gliding motility-associated C-terminal domain-containing protein [Saprospiraceae bacterium]|nr:gliding motility-associated C-terminal domain-containing protein [Lewinella sp.]
MKWIFFLFALACSFPALAQQTQTYIVTKTVDTATGGCQVGDCSLRSAITAANSDGVPSIIKFDFSTGSAPFTIFVRGTPLPVMIDDETIIDAMLDNSYNLGDVIIDGSLLTGTPNGLSVFGDQIEIYGLQIQNFGGDAIEAGATSGKISTRIGETGKGNIMILNGGHGLFVPIQVDVDFEGNYVGTDPAFTSGLGNTGRGIDFTSSTTASPPFITVINSVIGDNNAGGIALRGNLGFDISDNLIGTNSALNGNLSNTGVAITILDNLIGGGTIARNAIAYSRIGINVDAANQTTITENSMFCNLSSAIARSGNTMLIDITDASTTAVSGTSNVAGGTVEIFLQDLTGCFPGTACQGKTFLGTATVAGGVWTLNVTGQVALGDVVTATVTESTGTFPNTSPFATCQTISCPVINANIDVTPSCVAQNSGSISANPSGGIGPYQFNWSNGGTTATISNLPPGTYSVTIQDANGCRAADTATVGEVDGPTADAGADQTICEGESATLNGSATGGLGPYSFTWDPGGDGAVITVTPTATTVYELLVTDSRGCIDRDRMVVTVSPAPEQPNAGPDQTLCADEPATLAGSIGVDPNAPGIWTASVAGGTFSPDATALDAVYTPPTGATSITLTLSTTNGTVDCPNLSDEMILTYVAGPTVYAGPDQTLCAGTPATLAGSVGGTGTSGGWSATVAGGTFSPDELVPDAVYTPPVGIASVTLTLTAVDASGLGLCPDVQDEMVIIYTSSSDSADAGPDQEICNGETVQLAGSFSGGATDALWTTDGDGTFSDETALDAIYTPGPNDITTQGAVLTLTTSGNAFCLPASDDMTFRIRTVPNYTVSGTDPSTCGDPDGNFVISGLTPGEAYDGRYTLAGAVINISQDASATGEIIVDNLGPGIYTDIVLTDGFGCSGPVLSVELGSPDGPAVSVDISPICQGSTGNVVGTVSGGTSPYTHQWIDQGSGSAGNYQLSNENTENLLIDASAAQTGTIDLLYQVMDGGGCTASIAVSVTINALPEISNVMIDSASSASLPDGSLQFDLSGGQAPYNYSWSGPESGSATLSAAGTANILNLQSGQYSLQVSDANGCMTSLRFRIGIDSGSGVCTSNAGSMQATNGVVQSCQNTPIALVHNGDDVQDADDALVFALRELNGQIVKINLQPVFDFNPDNMTLNTVYRASALVGNASAAGGNQVDLSDPCLDESNAVELVFRESLSGVLNYIQGEDELCQGEELILSTNNLGTLEYMWITPARDTIRTAEPMVILPNIQPEDAGAYYVIARDGDCLNDQTGPFDLIVNGLPVGNPICAGDDQTACDNSVQLQACDPGPGIGSWMSLSGATINNPGSASTTALNLSPGVNLFVWTVEIPACGTVGSDTVLVLYESALFAQPDAFILERANTEIFMDVLKNDNIAEGTDYELTALTEPDFGTLETLDHGFRFYETEMRRGRVEFVYQVCYLGGTCSGTCDTATVAIDVLNLPYVAEGITPDGDGRNDELTILGYTPGDSELRLEMTIANQWGEIVFHSNDYTNAPPWKGMFKGTPVPQGAYYCHLKTTVPEGEFERQQTIYVVR